jgi:hypothetical protein
MWNTPMCSPNPRLELEELEYPEEHWASRKIVYWDGEKILEGMKWDAFTLTKYSKQTLT